MKRIVNLADVDGQRYASVSDLAAVLLEAASLAPLTAPDLAHMLGQLRSAEWDRKAKRWVVDG